jgi:hypothetical protein
VIAATGPRGSVSVDVFGLGPHLHKGWVLVGAAGSAAPYYANCDAVRAAGNAPLHRGDPGCRSDPDRDGDGGACE